MTKFLITKKKILIKIEDKKGKKRMKKDARKKENYYS